MRMNKWVWIAGLQVAALAVIAYRFNENGSQFLTQRLGDGLHCGLLEESEYVIVSRSVVLPEGVRAAAGKLQPFVLDPISLVMHVSH